VLQVRATATQNALYSSDRKTIGSTSCRRV